MKSDLKVYLKNNKLKYIKDLDSNIEEFIWVKSPFLEEDDKSQLNNITRNFFTDLILKLHG